MTTMKAIRMPSYGGAEVLVYEDAARPEAQAGEVLIQVYAAAKEVANRQVNTNKKTDRYSNYKMVLHLACFKLI
jgi:NADPH:quinone reductase-like Zn-dependent oxidoreductase